VTFKGLLRAGAASVVAAGSALGAGSGSTRVAAADYTRYHTYDERHGRVPPRFMNEELCHRNMAFSLYQADEISVK
jgi:hypothetical protein